MVYVYWLKFLVRNMLTSTRERLSQDETHHIDQFRLGDQDVAKTFSGS